MACSAIFASEDIIPFGAMGIFCESPLLCLIASLQSRQDLLMRGPASSTLEGFDLALELLFYGTLRKMFGLERLGSGLCSAPMVVLFGSHCARAAGLESVW